MNSVCGIVFAIVGVVVNSVVPSENTGSKLEVPFARGLPVH